MTESSGRSEKGGAESGASIRRAQEQLDITREELTRAREALLALLVERGGADSIRRAVEDVHNATGLDSARIQQALWALVHERVVRLGDEFELEALG